MSIKRCPMQFQHGTADSRCFEDNDKVNRCAWWVDEKKQCAIVVLAGSTAKDEITIAPSIEYRGAG